MHSIPPPPPRETRLKQEDYNLLQQQVGIASQQAVSQNLTGRPTIPPPQRSGGHPPIPAPPPIRTIREGRLIKEPKTKKGAAPSDVSLLRIFAGLMAAATAIGLHLAAIALLVVAVLHWDYVLMGLGLLGLPLMLVWFCHAVASEPEAKPQRAKPTKQVNAAEKARSWLLGQEVDELPASATQVITTMLAQLEKLSAQMEGVDESHPAMGDIKRLLDDDLPQMMRTYNDVPEDLRQKAYLGRTPDEQLTEGLTTISDEINDFKQVLAQGPLDALATRTRYLGYKYGNGEEPATA